MAMTKTLVSIGKLKTNLLKENPFMRYVCYDKDNDTMLVQIVPPDHETVVHFLEDDNVALLYEAKSKEIVGIQVEDFQKTFVPKHIGLKQFWTMSVDVKELGELLIVGESYKNRVAEKVVQASNSAIEKDNKKIANVFTKSFSQSDVYTSASVA
jgi:hypothetical protein